MQEQLEIVKEVISSFLKDRKEGKKQLVEWFLNSVMEEEAGIQISADPYRKTVFQSDSVFLSAAGQSLI
jgi:hypothetical protein